MSDQVSLHTFRNLTQAPNAESTTIRVSKSTGDLTTNTHGIFSRAIRFVFGPTEKDLKNNKVIVDQFIKDMRAQFTPEIADQALVHVNLIRQDKDGINHYRPFRGLDTRTVADAIGHAERLTREESVKSSVLRDLKAPTTMSTSQFKDEIAANMVGRGEKDSLDAAENKVDRTMSALDRETIDQATHIYGKLRETLDDFVNWMQHDFDPGEDDGLKGVAMVSRLRMLTDDVLQTGALVPRSDIGGDDRALAFDIAVRAFVENLDPSDARELAEKLAAPTNRAFVLQVALEQAGSDIPLADASGKMTVGYTNQLIFSLVQSIDQKAGEAPSSSSSDPFKPASSAIEDHLNAIGKGRETVSDDAKSAVGAFVSDVRQYGAELDARNRQDLADIERYGGD